MAEHIMMGFLFPALVFFAAGAWEFALAWWGSIIIWEAWKAMA